jgi:hypothetical protein
MVFTRAFPHVECVQVLNNEACWRDWLALDTLTAVPSSILLEADLGDTAQEAEQHWQLWLLALLAVCFDDNASTMQAVTHLAELDLPLSAPVPAFANALQQALAGVESDFQPILVLTDQQQQPLPVLATIKTAATPLKTLQCGSITSASLQHALQQALFNNSTLLVQDVALQPELWPALISFVLPSARSSTSSSNHSCQLILTASYPNPLLPTALLRVSRLVMATLVSGPWLAYGRNSFATLSTLDWRG